MKRAWIISIGTELALGQTVDTNSAWLAQRLAELGIRADRHLTIADELDEIRDCLLEAARHCDVVIVSGGLGPTDDDLTREAFAAAGGVDLNLHPESLARIRAFFAARNREMPERNRSQAMVPVGAGVIDNTCGTAPGISTKLSGTPFYALPGVPFEMKAMFESDVRPQLAAAAAGRAIRSRVMQTYGLGESEVGQRISDLMARDRNPNVGTTAQLGIVGIRINATGDSPEIADTMAGATEAEIAVRLGDYVFGSGDETLASAVGRLLRESQATVATAESCTGGLLSKLLTDVSGSSAYFFGGVVSYADQAKAALLAVDADLIRGHGAVSEAVAEAMACGALARFGSDFAISITGIAGPDGGSAEKPVGLVHIGLAEREKQAYVRKFLFGPEGPRDVIRQRAACAALNLLRLRLLGGK